MRTTLVWDAYPTLLTNHPNSGDPFLPEKLIGWSPLSLKKRTNGSALYKDKHQRQHVDFCNMTHPIILGKKKENTCCFFKKNGDDHLIFTPYHGTKTQNRLYFKTSVFFQPSHCPFHTSKCLKTTTTHSNRLKPP